MQIDELEERNPQPTAGLNPERDADPAMLNPDLPGDDDSLDDQPDGDRQLTTDSDVIDGGINDSDLGAAQGFTDIRDLGPDVTGGQSGGDATGDRATGLTGTRD